MHGYVPPPRLNVGLLVGFFALVAAIVVGLLVDFAPEPWLVGRSTFLLGCVLGLALVGWMAVSTLRRGGDLFDQGLRSVVGLVAIPIFMGGVTLIVIGRFVPAVITLATGAPVVEIHRMHTEYSRRKRGCDTRLYSRELRGARLCLAPETFDRFPRMDVDVEIHGLRGPLGLWVSAYEVLGPSAPPPDAGAAGG